MSIQQNPGLTPKILRVTTAGSVDDGKSTLIGRLLLEQGAIYEDQYQGIQRTNQAGHMAPDLALVTDGLKSEREQGITIDVAYKYFSTPRLKVILSDAPGHVQYTRNMVTAASRADVAIVLVDATQGITEQTRRHAYLLHLLRVPKLIIAINKIDLTSYSASVYAQIRDDFLALPWQAGHQNLDFIPVSALCGDNISSKSTNMPWYHGPSLLQYLETASPKLSPAAHGELDVQLVLRDPGGKRLAAGTLLGGQFNLNDEVTILPSRQKSRIKQIFVHGENLSSAAPGTAIAVALDDEVDLERGQYLCNAEDFEPFFQASHDLCAYLVWFDQEPLNTSTRYLLRHGNTLTRATLNQLHHRIDLTLLKPTPAATLAMNDIGLVTIHTAKELYTAAYRNDKQRGSFILIDPLSFRTVALGFVEDSLGANAQSSKLHIQSYAFGSDPGRSVQHHVNLPRSWFAANSEKTAQDVIDLLLGHGYTLSIEDEA